MGILTTQQPLEPPTNGVSKQSELLNVDRLLEELTLEEKVALTAGRDFWHTVPIPRLNIPSLRLSDGPNGVRGTRFFDAIPAACLPCGTGLGATFDADLLEEVGNLLAEECKAKSVHVLLGPTINIPRAPLGGRGFESYSEDPHLAGVLAGRYCKGVEDKGIVATLKHFVCNDQEDQRMAYNAIVTDRALREIYLAPFQIALKHCQTGAIMTAYNKVNGTHVSESEHILKDILRDEWKWDGLVMSDWFGTYSTSEAIKAGLDLEMPGATRWRGQALCHAVTANKVKKSELNARVRNVLNLHNRTRRGNTGVKEDDPELQLNRPEDRELVRKVAASSLVLLKNDNNVLPFKKDQRIAVIGPNSKVATICGGGSASLTPYYAVTPFEGIKAKATSGIDWDQGTYSHQSLPTIGSQLRTADGKVGFSIKIYNESPEVSSREMLEERTLHDSMVMFVGLDRQDLAPIWYVTAEGFFTAPESGLFDFGLAVQGTARLFIDDELLISNVENQRSGPSFIGCGTAEETGSMNLIAGQGYKITVKWASAKSSTLQAPGVVQFGHGGFRIAGCKRLDPKTGIQQAVDLARDCDQVVLFTGLSGEWETEGRDREHMDLPPYNDELISAVLDVNPNTVVVVQSGTPVTMPWADKAKAILQAWFGGNETGNAIADVLYGDVNPSGKLPLTIPRRIQDNPAYNNYRCENGRTLYGEDIYVGYRWYESRDITPLFAFGHGLSYTSFSLSSLNLTQKTSTNGDVKDSTTKDIMTISCSIQNTGSVPGAQVLQYYISSAKSVNVSRPVKELKGFKKVYLEVGEKKEVEMELEILAATSYWDESEEQWCCEKGVYRVLVGESSAADGYVEGAFEIERTCWWRGL